VSVISVYNYGYLHMVSCQSAEGSGFGGMGMYNVGFEIGDDRFDFPIGFIVEPRIDRSLHFGQKAGRNSEIFDNELGAVFTQIFHSPEQKGLELLGKVLGKVGRIVGRAS